MKDHFNNVTLVFSVTALGIPLLTNPFQIIHRLFIYYVGLQQVAQHMCPNISLEEQCLFKVEW